MKEVVTDSNKAELNAQKLEKLFKELDSSIEKKQFRLSRVICDAILLIDPESTRILPYIDQIPDDNGQQDQNLDLKSFTKLTAFFLTPGLIMFIVFYKFTKHTESTHEKHFVNKEIEREEKKKQSEKTQPSQGFKPKSEVESKTASLNQQNKQKFKFSTFNPLYSPRQTLIIKQRIPQQNCIIKSIPFAKVLKRLF